MTTHEATYFKNYIDDKLRQIVDGFDESDKEKLKLSMFEDKYMSLITGQQMLPQTIFRRFLSEFSGEIELLNRIKEAVGKAEDRVVEFENFANDKSNKLQNELDSLVQIENRIADELFTLKQDSRIIIVDNRNDLFDIDWEKIGVGVHLVQVNDMPIDSGVLNVYKSVRTYVGKPKVEYYKLRLMLPDVYYEGWVNPDKSVRKDWELVHYATEPIIEEDIADIFE